MIYMTELREELVNMLDTIFAASNVGEDVEVFVTPMVRCLKHVGIEIYAPKPGDTFDPWVHNSVGGPYYRFTNNECEKIKSCTRAGLKIGGQITRYADVITSPDEGTFLEIMYDHIQKLPKDKLRVSPRNMVQFILDTLPTTEEKCAFLLYTSVKDLKHIRGGLMTLLRDAKNKSGEKVSIYSLYRSLTKISNIIMDPSYFTPDPNTGSTKFGRLLFGCSEISIMRKGDRYIDDFVRECDIPTIMKGYLSQKKRYGSNSEILFFTKRPKEDDEWKQVDLSMSLMFTTGVTFRVVIRDLSDKTTTKDRWPKWSIWGTPEQSLRTTNTDKGYYK